MRAPPKRKVSVLMPFWPCLSPGKGRLPCLLDWKEGSRAIITTDLVGWSLNEFHAEWFQHFVQTPDNSIWRHIHACRVYLELVALPGQGPLEITHEIVLTPVFHWYWFYQSNRIEGKLSSIWTQNLVVEDTWPRCHTECRGSLYYRMKSSPRWICIKRV